MKSEFLARLKAAGGQELELLFLPPPPSIAQFSDSQKTTFDYTKVLGAGETLVLLLPAISELFRKKRCGGGGVTPVKLGGPCVSSTLGLLPNLRERNS